MFNIAQIFAAGGIILVSAGMARTMSAQIAFDRTAVVHSHSAQPRKRAKRNASVRTVRKTEPRDL